MSVLNAGALFSAAARPAMAPVGNGGRAQRVDANGNPLKDAEIWLNVGVLVETTDPDTGEKVQEHLTLPVNLAIDTMRKREVPNRKPTTAKAKQFLDRIIASNELLEGLQKASAALEPGETITLEGFTLQLQRVNEKVDVDNIDTSDNQYLSQIRERLAVSK